MNLNEISFFLLFNITIIVLLFLDISIIGKKSHEIGFKEAFLWTIFWIILALGFYFFIRHFGDNIHGITSKEDIQIRIDKFKHPIIIDNLSYEEALTVYRNNLSLEYLTGYLIEKSLSVDNLFVMIMIFFGFGVKKIYYKRVLFWGILGALIMRFIFIFGSSVLIQQFEWVLYLFGTLLIYTGVNMFIKRNKKEKPINVSKHIIVRFTSKYLRVFPRYVGKRFFIKNKTGKLFFTPLFIVLLVIEFSDVLFAVDSIPAIFSITEDPYIIFFSNIFAILGLRALFFLILNALKKFRYLQITLSILLTFIGLKLIFNYWLKEIGFSTLHSLYVVLFFLISGIILSLIFPENKESTN